MLLPRKTKVIYLKECFYEKGLNTGQLFEYNRQHALNDLIVAPSDFQVGKTGSRGGTQELIARVMRSYERIEHLLYITIAAVFLGPGVAALFLKNLLG